MRPSLFGTDGVRGQANRPPMTVETGVALGRAIAHVFRQGHHRPKILIGKDTRISGYLFENALAAGVCAVGGEAYLMGPMPTPGVAFLTVSMRADAGVVISASHNSFEDNGLKFFGRDGFKLNDQVEAQISQWIANDETRNFDVTGADIGKAYRVTDVLGRYVVFLKSTFPRKLSLNGMRVYLDCANGAAYKVAPLVLNELGATLITMGTEPDGININAGCGAVSPEILQQKVRESGADVGIALDGDADRCILVDEKGELVDGDRILGISARWYRKNEKLQNNALVATVMTNLGLEKALKADGINMIRCAVGDRNVVASMRQHDLVLGGEQSGHVIFLDHATTGDGIGTALQVLAQMQESGTPLSELKNFYTPLPQILRNVVVKERTPIDDLSTVQRAMKQGDSVLGSDGRILVRYSGTEAKLRIMAEGPSLDVLEQVVDDIQDAVQTEIGI